MGLVQARRLQASSRWYPRAEFAESRPPPFLLQWNARGGYYIRVRYIDNGYGLNMKSTNPDPLELLPLTPAVFHILLSLAEGERHGYGIMQEVESRTQNQVRLGPGTLYGSIKRMLADGLIEESGERADPRLDNERRRYYRLTRFGRRVAVAEAHRLERLVVAARERRLLRT
jgi:DNA-binding PadR family transcriptional regulator